METQSLEGKLNNGVGSAQSVAGDLLDDPALKLKGKARQVSGKVEEAAGAAKEKVGVAADRARDFLAKAADQASDTYGALRGHAQTTADATDAFVKARPYAATGLAALAGFVIGALFLTRGPKVIYLKPARDHGA